MEPTAWNRGTIRGYAPVGVDVFFVVSGFLITGHLYRELSSTGTIKLSKFWARRVMRLLPLAFTVLLFSVVVMLLFVPQTVWAMNVRQILGSLFYVQNWVLAADSVDYMAADNEPSLVQHYWSLSIEEQFYIVLPLILLGAYLVTKFWRKHRDDTSVNTQKLFIWTLASITVLTFIFSVAYTNYNAAQAYFVTPTRFWEFAIGGLLAMLPAATKLPARFQNLLGWTGVAAIIIAALAYDGNTAFPGYTALLPVIGSVLFLRYGSAQPVTGVYWWASRKPALRMGDWSYAIYLWHWPLIIVATYQLEPFTWPHKLGIIAVTFLLSAASQRLIEDPLRHAKPFKLPKRAFTLMASNMAIIAALTFFIPQLLSPNTNEEVAIDQCTGANALLTDCQDKGLNGQPLIPATQVQTEAEEPDFTECDTAESYTDFENAGCSFGAAEEDADLTLAMLGDSHARAWLPMLDEVARDNNWNIRGYTMSGCTPVPLSSADPDSDQQAQETSDNCEQFVEDTAEGIETSDEIDAVITAASPTDRDFYDASGNTSDQLGIDALHEMWGGWDDAGKDVIVIGEVPHFDELNGPTCIESNQEDSVSECSVPVEDILGERDTIMTDAAAEGATPVSFYDPVPGICDDERCYSQVGDLITRYDHHHLSEDFARSFSADFESFLDEEAIAVS